MKRILIPASHTCGGKIASGCLACAANDMAHQVRLNLINKPFPTVTIRPGSSWDRGGGKKPSLEQLEGSVSYAGREFGATRE